MNRSLTKQISYNILHLFYHEPVILLDFFKDQPYYWKNNRFMKKIGNFRNFLLIFRTVHEISQVHMFYSNSLFDTMAEEKKCVLQTWHIDFLNLTDRLVNSAPIPPWKTHWVYCCIFLLFFCFLFPIVQLFLLFI